MSKRKLIGWLNIYCSMLILLVICVFAAILSPSFLSVANLFNMFKQVTVAGIMGCGMTFVTLAGGIDLSVGSILGLTGVLAPGILESTDNAEVTIPATLAVGIECGVVNGFFVAVCEIPPFIPTLGMVTLLHGCIPAYTKGSPTPIKVDGYKFLDKRTVAGVLVPIIILIILPLIAHYVLTRTGYGRSIYAFGGNRETVHLSGISVRFTERMAYTLNGLTCGIVDVILTTRLDSARSTSGTGIEMDAIAAVILGGTPSSGDVGFVLPAVVGATTMGITDNILTLINVDPHATSVVRGVAILIAVLMDKKVKGLSAEVEQQIENRVNTK